MDIFQNITFFIYRCKSENGTININKSNETEKKFNYVLGLMSEKVADIKN